MDPVEWLLVRAFGALASSGAGSSTVFLIEIFAAPAAAGIAVTLADVMILTVVICLRAFRNTPNPANTIRAIESHDEKAEQCCEKSEQLLQGEIDPHGLHPHGAPLSWLSSAQIQTAKYRIQYQDDRFHFAICSTAGSRKSSLVNSLRGPRKGGPGAAKTGATETTTVTSRYPDLRADTPFSRFVWYDLPGAGILERPSKDYFHKQGLFIFVPTSASSIPLCK